MLSIVSVVRVAVVLILVVLAVLVPGAGAQAHAALREINPADGARLDTPPSAVRLTFTEDVLQGTAQLQLTGPAGQVETPVTSDGAVVSGAVPPDLAPGAYTLLWRVTSADGHPISGRSAFTVLAAAPSAGPTTEPGSDAVAESSTLSAAGQSPAATIDPLDPASPGAGTGTRVAIALGAVLAAAAAVASVVARRRRP